MENRHEQIIGFFFQAHVFLPPIKINVFFQIQPLHRGLSPPIIITIDDEVPTIALNPCPSSNRDRPVYRK